MSLSASEARALTRIERGLRSRDPRLSSLFSTFTQLTWREAMPVWEQLRRRRWRPQPAVVIVIALALAVAMVAVGAIVSPPRTCAPVRLGPTVAKTLSPGCPAGTSANPLR
jgi:cobalamin synthase